jgi:hypothetical protein
MTDSVSVMLNNGLRRFGGSCLVVLLCASGVPSAMAAEIEADWHAFVQNDMRGANNDNDEPGMYRNESTAGVSLKMTLVPYRLRFVGDVSLVWTGFSKDKSFSGLTDMREVSPYSIRSDAAYIESFRLIPYVDLRIGRQIVQWGAADQFNPTNNLNALDLGDPLQFGRTIANQMIRVDFNPGDSDFTLTAVWVPVFQPARLPGSALLQIGDVSSELPFVSPETRLAAERLRNIYLTNPTSYDVEPPEVNARMPETTLKNSQVGVRAQWLIGNVDASLSWYYGRDSVPVSKRSISSQTSSGRRSAAGTPVMRVLTDVDLVYPRKQVLGFDLAGELSFLDHAGFWLEGAATFPRAVTLAFDITRIVPSATVLRDDVVTDSPFFKGTVGMDYSIGEHVYLMGQFIHGMPDEFGLEAIRNYCMGMIDVKLLQERLVIRQVVLGEIPHDDDDINLDDDGDGRVESLARGATNDGRIGSLVYFPQLILKPLDGLELTAGAYLRFGHRESKFATEAAGPSQIIFSARASF